jgi:Ethanolamine utilization protein EutJ (predicted chaperonin)
VEVAGAAQPLSRLRAGGTILARVVDHDHGHVVCALQRAQVGQDGGYVARVILVDAVQAHERIEQQHSGRELPHGLFQPELIAIEYRAARRAR